MTTLIEELMMILDQSKVVAYKRKQEATFHFDVAGERLITLYSRGDANLVGKKLLPILVELRNTYFQRIDDFVRRKMAQPSM